MSYRVIWEDVLESPKTHLEAAQLALEGITKYGTLSFTVVDLATNKIESIDLSEHEFPPLKLI